MAGSPSNGGLFRTSDLTLAAYLKHRGLVCRSAKRIGRRRFEFWFEDPEAKAQTLRLDLLNSEIAVYDAHLRSLKKMVEETRLNGNDGDGA